MLSPDVLRCTAYFDAQWFFRTAKSSFGNQLPDFSPQRLAEYICGQRGWKVTQVRYYVDVPSYEESPWWHHLWMNRVNDLSQAGVYTWTIAQNLRSALGIDSDTRKASRVLVKSDIDVTLKLSLDALNDVLTDSTDVVLLFSKENKYRVLVDQLRNTAQRNDKYLKLATAFPRNPNIKHSHAGIDRTDWFPLSHDAYLACVEHIRVPRTQTESDNTNDVVAPTTEVAIAETQA